MAKEYCVYCMTATEGGACPHCGRTKDSYQAAVHQLQPGTVLNDKYQIGAVLGEGGFGITYIGRDITLDMKIAIKEYFPNGAVNRNNTHSSEVTQTTGPTQALFEKGKGSFLTEARTLAKFAAEPNCVSVRDFFESNNTAYIVMEYLEGTDLKSYLDKRGKLSFSEVYTLLSPVMKVLGRVHKQGLIHRDISPANIMVLDNGQAKLLDFGAARDVSGEDEKSLSILLKPGYAPEEQYRTKGKQGAWTDVYALSATVYKLLTGITPEDSMNRVFADEVEKISVLNPDVTPEQEAVVMKGMAVKMEDRYQTMEEMLNAYQLALSPSAAKSKSVPSVQNMAANVIPDAPKPQKSKKPLIAIGAVCAVAVIAIGIGATVASKKSAKTTDGNISFGLIGSSGSGGGALTAKPDAIYIDWSDNALTDEDIASLANYQNLTSIKLNNCGLTNEMLAEIAKLNMYSVKIADNPDITDLSVLGNLEKLNELDISGLSEEAIASLPELSHMTEFYCQRCNLTDLSIIDKIANVKTLHAEENKITDISALNGREDLEAMYLYLDNNAVNDISALKEGEGPRILSITRNQITDLSPLEDHSEIVELYVGNNQIQDITPLKDCFKIKLLDISSNQIEDISALSTINELKAVLLLNNKITSLEPLSACTNMLEYATVFDASNNQLKNTKGIEGFKNLRKLQLEHNQLTELNLPQNNSSLNYIYLNDNQLNSDALEQIASQSELKQLEIVDNPITDMGYLTSKSRSFKASDLYIKITYTADINWQQVSDTAFQRVDICDVDNDRTKDELKQLGFNRLITTQDVYDKEEHSNKLW